MTAGHFPSKHRAYLAPVLAAAVPSNAVVKVKKVPHDSLTTWRLAGSFPFPVARAYQNFVNTQRTRGEPDRALSHLLICSEALLQPWGALERNADFQPLSVIEIRRRSW